MARGLRAERIAVDLAGDGALAWEWLASCQYDLVIHLRCKVDDPFPTKLIRTVRGMGYTITDEPEA